jgi:hypothetical protein
MRVHVAIVEALTQFAGHSGAVCSVARVRLRVGAVLSEQGEEEVRHEPTSGYEDPSLNYRVTWRSVDDGGTTHERVFTSRDQGWDFYQQMQRSASAYGESWEHIPA